MQPLDQVIRKAEFRSQALKEASKCSSSANLHHEESMDVEILPAYLFFSLGMHNGRMILVSWSIIHPYSSAAFSNHRLSFRAATRFLRFLLTQILQQ